MQMKLNPRIIAAISVTAISSATSQPLPLAEVSPTFMSRSFTTVGKNVFVLRDALTITFPSGIPSITVPEGFITDLASIPKGLHWWEGKTDATMAPAILHDYLYWYQPCTKDEADAVMFVAMRALNVGPTKASAIYQVVSDYRSAWEDNKNRRLKGEIRTLTAGYATKLRQSPFQPSTPLEKILRDAKNANGFVVAEAASQETRQTCKVLLDACSTCQEYLGKRNTRTEVGAQQAPR
jgi:hypothetical protein